MKKRDLEQTRKLNRSQLKKKVEETMLELKKISVKIASGGENNLKLAKNKKRELAQLLTILKSMPKENLPVKAEKKETKK